MEKQMWKIMILIVFVVLSNNAMAERTKVNINKNNIEWHDISEADIAGIKCHAGMINYNMSKRKASLQADTSIKSKVNKSK
jgi:catabolite regulation protein CreA